MLNHGRLCHRAILPPNRCSGKRLDDTRNFRAQTLWRITGTRGRARRGGSEWHDGSKNGLSHFQAIRFAPVWVEVGHILWMKGYYGRPVMLPAAAATLPARRPVTLRAVS